MWVGEQPRLTPPVRSSPYGFPLLRYGVGLRGAAVVAFVAFTYLDGTARWIVLGIAVPDALVTPMIPKRAAT